jgi:argininosuccinate synthase
MDLSKRALQLKEEYPSVKKVALSYSGGLDSSVAGRLLSKAGFEVLPVAVDIGQRSDFARIVSNAKSLLGDCRAADMREIFAQSAQRAIKSNFGSDGNLNSGGISRPALAAALAKEAREAGCQAIAHGSSGIGNEHLVMENALRTIAPEMRIMAIVRDLDLRRDDALAFAAKEKLPTNLLRAKGFSADENLWGRAIRQGFAIDPSAPIPEKAYKWTVSPQAAPPKMASVEVEFSGGAPVDATINGKRVSGAAAIFLALNETGGRHGVGRADALEDKAVGLKSREAYECPAAMILLAAHRQLESLTLTTRELEAKAQSDALWARLVREGGWYTRLRRSLDAFTDELERPVEGSVSLELYRGSIIVRGRKSRRALYDSRLSSRDSKGVFSQKEARQFAKLYGLQDVMAYMVDSD